MQKESFDIEWVNLNKAFCMLLIFLLHAQAYCDVKIWGVTSYYSKVHVDAFFFISGYLLFRKQLSPSFVSLDRHSWWNVPGGGKTLTSNVWFRIVLPTVLFAIINFFPKMVLRGLSFNGVDFVSECFLGGTLWFTWALAIAEFVIIIGLIFRRCTIGEFFLIGIACVIIETVINSNNLVFLNNKDLPWQYREGLIAVLFLVMGGFFMLKEKKFDSFFNSLIGRVLLVLFIIPYIAILYYQKENDSFRNLFNEWHLYYFLDLGAILVLIYFFKWLKGCDLSNYIGRHSIGFYFFSGAFPNVIAVAFHKAIPNFNSPFLPILVGLLAIAITYWIVKALNRWIPFVFDMRLLWKKQ